MREISLYEHEDLDRLPIDTFLIYGDTGTGKTTCTGGFPRPLILADASEAGWKSLRGLSDEQLFEPDVNPMIWEISEMNDVANALPLIPPLIASGRIRTVALSSVTFYANTYLAHLMRNDAKADPRQIYGALGVHLREIRTRFHSLGVNIVWEALADHPESGGDGKQSKPGRPAIAGKSADTFAAGVTYLWRSMLEETREGGKVTDRKLKLYTAAYGGYLARSRIGTMEPQLPNPLLDGYKGFLKARGYDVDRLRRALPPIKPTVSTPAKSTTPATAKPISAPKSTTPTSGAKATTTTNTK